MTALAKGNKSTKYVLAIYSVGGGAYYSQTTTGLLESLVLSNGQVEKHTL